MLLAACALVDTADVRPAAAPSPSLSPGPSLGTNSGAGVGGVPVWYDAKGLHRGDTVEQTPVPLGAVDGQDISGALALVRSGALYLDPATGDVWFHPWGGEPRIVGRNSAAGPGGDPNGDIAAWFEGYDLVVYDTAAGREISRSRQATPLQPCGPMCAEHISSGNGFRYVSADRVVWDPMSGAVSYDVRTGRTALVEGPAAVLDVHAAAGVGVFADFRGNRDVILRAPGRSDARYPDFEARARLSASGKHVLIIEEVALGHGAVSIETGTGDLWGVSTGYSWIAWSYGDIALVDTGVTLQACDAARRTCQTLPAERPFLLPTN